MFDQDERATSGWDVAKSALARARGGGTLVLNLPETWDAKVSAFPYLATALGAIKRARDDLGFDVHRVASWDTLVAFAKEFSRRNYVPAEVG
jgi:hypothetical protein